MSAKHHAVLVVGLPFIDLPEDIQHQVRVNSGYLGNCNLFQPTSGCWYQDCVFGVKIEDVCDGFSVLEFDRPSFAAALKDFKETVGLAGRLYISKWSY